MLSLSFGYVQYGLALVSGLFLLPFILAHVGTREYGLWLAGLEVLACMGLIDLGVINVMPWLIAECDGRGDRAALKGLLVEGLTLAVLSGLVYLCLSLFLWRWLPVLITSTTAVDLQCLFNPLLIVIVSTAFVFPARVAHAVLAGLQDVAFNGRMTLLQSVLNIGMILFMIWSGYGLYALACATAVPPLIFFIVMSFRLRIVAPDLFVGWHRPTRAGMAHLFRQGLASFMGSLGWRLSAASNNLVIVAAGGSGAAAVAVAYSCTSRLGEMCLQLVGQFTDSGLVGLAQLRGEGKTEHIRKVVTLMVRIALVVVSGMAAVLLALNPTFVMHWIGADKFGGLTVNALLAVGIVAGSLLHVVVNTTAVLGGRLPVALLALVRGVVHLGLAALLFHFHGLVGLALAGLLGTFLVALPFNGTMFFRYTGVSFALLWHSCFQPWLPRATLLLVLSGLAGCWLARATTWVPLLTLPFLGITFLVVMVPLCTDFPLPGCLKNWRSACRCARNVNELS